nr:hypothetical protein MA16_Dca024339 [Tanacetum cinerariifolium]
MSLANQKATTEYQEAIQATEDIEPQAVGFAKTADSKEGMSWNLKPPKQMSVRVPSRVAVNKRLNRSDCLNEARILEDEPLNKVRRSNKPRRSRRRSEEKWSTLGEPSRKWDYYVRYDTPLNTIPIEEVAATGWGEEFSDDEVTREEFSDDEVTREEFSDDEVTPRKVTILNEVQEESDWDDDLVIQERHAQNQQDFLDEYLPQWDDHLATQKQQSELEWENPFAAKRAQIIKKHEEHVFPSTSQEESTQSYQPPHDSIMGPSVYPPAQQNPQSFYRPDYQFGYPQGKSKLFSGGYGEYHNSQWTLPPAWTESGVMLVLPADPGLWSEVRKLILQEDPYRGSTDEQDKAYRDLDRITCEETKNLWSFLEDFKRLATKSGRLYFPSTTEKLFAKLPPSLSKKIEESFRAKYPGLNSGVLPAIKFTHTFVSEMCKDTVLAKELRDLSLCSAIPIPGYYKKEEEIWNEKIKNIQRKAA